MLSKSARPPTLSIKALAARFHKQCVRSRQDLQHSASKYPRHVSSYNAYEAGKTSFNQHRNTRGTSPRTMRSKSAIPPTLRIEPLAARLHKQCVRSRQDLQRSASKYSRHASTSNAFEVSKASNTQQQCRGTHGTPPLATCTGSARLPTLSTKAFTARLYQRCQQQPGGKEEAQEQGTTMVRKKRTRQYSKRKQAAQGER